jgi:hypothetical protein
MPLWKWVLIVALAQMALATVLGSERGWMMVVGFVLFATGFWWFAKRPSRAQRHFVTLVEGTLHVTTPEGGIESMAIADVDEIAFETGVDVFGESESRWVLIGIEPRRRLEIPLQATFDDAFDGWLDTLGGVDHEAYPGLDVKGPRRATYWKRSAGWKPPDRPVPPEATRRIRTAWKHLKVGAVLVGICSASSLMLLREFGIPPGKPMLVPATTAVAFWVVVVWIAVRRQFAGDGWTVVIADGQLHVTDTKGRTQSLDLTQVRQVTSERRRTFVHGWHQVWVVDGAARCEIPGGASNEFEIFDWLRTQPGYDEAGELAAMKRFFDSGPTVPIVLWTRR